MTEQEIRNDIKHSAEEIVNILGRNDDITRGVQKALWEQVDSLAKLLDELSSQRPPWED